MDIDSLAKSVSLFGSVLNTVKQALTFLPNPKRAEAEEVLKRAEQEFKIFEAKIASELDYQICRKHFPPVIMLLKDHYNWKCPECGGTVNTHPGLPAVSKMSREDHMLESKKRIRRIANEE